MSAAVGRDIAIAVLQDLAACGVKLLPEATPESSLEEWSQEQFDKDPYRLTVAALERVTCPRRAGSNRATTACRPAALLTQHLEGLADARSAAGSLRQMWVGARRIDDAPWIDRPGNVVQRRAAADRFNETEPPRRGFRRGARKVI
jgi:hypothetical protein